MEQAVQFTWASWIVVFAYMLFTTWLGHRLSGKQQTIRDFFLGGRKLPWYAVSGSVIATEISAMTLVGIPAFLWAETGDLRYAGLAIGNIASRFIIGFFLIPVYYERDIYSPYEYMGNMLGKRANTITSVLFMVTAILGQGVRVLLTAIVLSVITGWNIHTCVWATGGVALLWTVIGGIVTVVWTDVIQFFVFLIAAITALVAVVWQFSEYLNQDTWTSISQIWTMAAENHKLRWLDFIPDVRQNYTFISVTIASCIGCVFSYGADQLMVQRLFCCKNRKEASKAIMWSSVGQVTMLICLFVGVALWAFYQKMGVPGVPSAAETEQIGANSNRILAVFIKYRINWFMGGIMVAGVFAAAISSIEGVLAALSQQTLHALRPAEEFTEAASPETQKRNIRTSRYLVLLWAVVLCASASLFQIVWQGSGLIIELALAVTSYIAGATLGVFVMAFFKKLRRDPYGMGWTATISCLTIFVLSKHNPFPCTAEAIRANFLVAETAWHFYVLAGIVVAMFVTAIRYMLPRDPSFILKMLVFTVMLFFLYWFQYDSPGTQVFKDYSFGLSLSHYEPLAETKRIGIDTGWPWYTPIGAVVMLAASLWMCTPKRDDT